MPKFGIPVVHPLRIPMAKLTAKHFLYADGRFSTRLSIVLRWRGWCSAGAVTAPGVDQEGQKYLAASAAEIFEIPMLKCILFCGRPKVSFRYAWLGFLDRLPFWNANPRIRKKNLSVQLQRGHLGQNGHFEAEIVPLKLKKKNVWLFLLFFFSHRRRPPNTGGWEKLLVVQAKGNSSSTKPAGKGWQGRTLG